MQKKDDVAIVYILKSFIAAIERQIKMESREIRAKRRISMKKSKVVNYVVNYVEVTYHTANSAHEPLTSNKDEPEKTKFKEACDKEISQLMKM